MTTRQGILDVAERLIGAKGVYGFTLRDIAAPLGMQVPAIYKHYRSRDDVLIEVSRRYIAQLATQFTLRPKLDPEAALRAGMDEFVEMMVRHPAYVRLALADFATPGGGMEYVKLAAGGAFNDNFVGGPLAPLHGRLRSLLDAGFRSGAFRRVDASDVYGLLKAALLIRLVFPDDQLLTRRPHAAQLRALQRWLWDVAARHLAPERPPGRHKRLRRGMRADAGAVAPAAAVTRVDASRGAGAARAGRRVVERSRPAATRRRVAL